MVIPVAPVTPATVPASRLRYLDRVLDTLREALDAADADLAREAVGTLLRQVARLPWRPSRQKLARLFLEDIPEAIEERDWVIARSDLEKFGRLRAELIATPEGAANDRADDAGGKP